MRTSYVGLGILSSGSRGEDEGRETYWDGLPFRTHQEAEVRLNAPALRFGHGGEAEAEAAASSESLQMAGSTTEE
jgi:hypothetical protein